MIIAIICLVLACGPAFATLANLCVLKRPDHAPPQTPISILIPARDEETAIADCVECALASERVDLEVIVLDDHSTDRTAAIVRSMALRDPRLRLESAPGLPFGWSGKQHACHHLGRLATKPLLVFVDADVRLQPDAASRLACALAGADLISCVPRQIMGSFVERALIPMINTVLLGYLPISFARRDNRPALAAGCGQLIAVRADAYRKAGGHEAIRQSLHDGLKLPRRFRAAGFRTDLVAGWDLASCRMYVGARATLAGSLKNATEGLAQPRALPIWTILLLGGHVLPPVLLVILLVQGQTALVPFFAAATLASLLARVAQAIRCREPLSSVPLHVFGMGLLVALQWLALARQVAGRPANWRGRSYPARS